MTFAIRQHDGRSDSGGYTTRDGLSGEQIRIIVQTVQQYGTLSLAAHNAGITPSRLRALMNADEDLRVQIEDAMSLFQDAIRLTVLERATAGRSDMLLKVAAEAFVPETFRSASSEAKAKGKPTGLMLRSFDDNGLPTNDGESASAPASAPASASVEKQAPKPPLKIEVWKGL